MTEEAAELSVILNERSARQDEDANDVSGNTTG